MAQSEIRWKRGDYIRLGRAVSDFNRKINKLQTEENKLYLPDTISYQNLKENITTRQELNRMVNSLRRFQREDATDLYTTQAGEQMTKWERRDLGIQTGIAKKRLNRELSKLNEPMEGGYSRVQMGSDRANRIEAQIRKLNKFENLKGSKFKNLKKSIKTQGTSDFSMKRAITYRENYMKEMEKYSSFENYKKLMKKLKSIKNPLVFYDFVSKNEITKDLTYQSDQYYAEQEFNIFVSDLLGEELNEGESLVNDYMEFKYEMSKGDEIEI